MRSAEIKRRFTDYFERNGHTVVPSASLILDDPTLLFVIAGMVPFKPYLLGQSSPRRSRARPACRSACAPSTSTRSARPPGTTRSSRWPATSRFGDYFKEGAITYAWELLTGVAGRRRLRLRPGPALGRPSTRTTTRPSTSGSRVIGVPEERIQRRGMADNFWSMGVPGPVRPLLGDLLRPRPRVRRRGRPGRRRGPLPRDLEPRLHAVRARSTGAGKEDFPILGELPKKNIDTGMGVERMAYLLQGVDNVYEIDEVFPVLGRAAELSGGRYGADHGARTSGCGWSPTTSARR